MISFRLLLIGFLLLVVVVVDVACAFTPSSSSSSSLARRRILGSSISYKEGSDIIVDTNNKSQQQQQQEHPSVILPFYDKKPDAAVIYKGGDSSSSFSSVSLLFQNWKQILITNINTLKETISSFRPATKFRIGLGTAAVVSLSIAQLVTPISKVITIVHLWISSRGFQGIAAMGRSIVYCWALLIGYPRLLDRRFIEKRQRERQRQQEKQEQLVLQLRSEVTRLQGYLDTIDAEIRSFRREIINLKAYATTSSSTSGSTTTDGSNGVDNNNNNGSIFNPDIQEAIAAEMKHLAHLRSDAQAALVAARQEWAKALSSSRVVQQK